MGFRVYGAGLLCDYLVLFGSSVNQGPSLDPKMNGRLSNRTAHLNKGPCIEAPDMVTPTHP